MTKLNSRRLTCIWLSVIILLISVAATTIAYVSRLDSFLLDDEGAISLINDNILETGSGVHNDQNTQGPVNTAPQTPTTEQGSTNNNNTSGTNKTDPDTSETPQVTQPPKKPGFEAGDDKTVWSTNTRVEIFRVSYVNGEQIITVKSDNGEKVIAPGTENSYTFKLKNTGNVALDYTVELDAYFTPADIEIPITGRLNRYDGKWVVGGRDDYVNVPVLDVAEDNGTLGAGKYTYYTLDWMWPFEGGDDELDTMLGNLATEQDLIFTIVIKTTATESDDPYDDGGITPPQTGDNSNLALWITLAISSFAMLVFLLFFQRKERRG